MATTTANQRRDEQKNSYNALLAGCPSRQLLDRLSSKWVVLILCALGGDGPEGTGEPRSLRYSQLSRIIAGVSQKMLTQTLRTLERDGLLTRTVTPTVPVTVDYTLTELGVSLHDTTRRLRAWAQDNMDSVQAHRADYDRLDASG
ncbi:winged helix-turn-helix transcriptional regulator [Williamsia sp. M5A3_1d]